MINDSDKIVIEGQVFDFNKISEECKLLLDDAGIASHEFKKDLAILRVQERGIKASRDRAMELLPEPESDEEEAKH